MNLGELTSRVQRQFGDEAGVQITAGDIRNWLNDAQVDIVRRTDVLQASLKTDVVANQPDYAVPNNFVKIRRVTVNGNLIRPTQLEHLDQLNPGRDNETTSIPNWYYTWGNSIYLYPTPSARSTLGLEIYYIRTPLVLNAPTDIPEIPAYMHEDLLRFALARAKELDEEEASAQRLMADYGDRMAQSSWEASNQQTDSYPAVRLLPGDF